MPSNYPNALDDWTNPSPGTLMNAPGFEHDVAHANVYDAIEKMQAELGVNPSGASATVKDRLDAATFSTIPYVTVASSTLDPTAAAGCHYQCTGTNDQTQINNALKKASRISDGFTGGEGWIGVLLVGDDFFVGHNGTSIKMYPNTKLMGLGAGTLIRPSFSGGYVGGAIETINADTHRFTISDLTIGNPTDTEFEGSGIKADLNDVGNVYDIKSANDGYPRIHRVNVMRANRKGIWFTGGREVHIDNVLIHNAVQAGLLLTGHSDAKIHRIVATGTNGTAPGIHFNSAGNSQLTDCKVFYRGNKAGGSPQHGFHIATSRVTMANCQAQDNGGYGFYIDGGVDHSISNCMADSNGAQDANTGGFFIGGSGSYSGIVASDRQQSTVRQNRGVVFSGSPQVYMSGRVGVDSGSAHVVGSPGANSYVRLVRKGTTLHSVG